MDTYWIIECKKYGPEHKVGVDIVRVLFGVKTNMTVVGGMVSGY